MGCIHGIPVQSKKKDQTEFKDLMANGTTETVPKETLAKTVTVRALYDYTARDVDDISFEKGDKLHLIGDYDVTDESASWWRARHVSSAMEGYIPSNFVRVEDGQPESHEGWFKISRREADKSLLLPGNNEGTFIIRPSSDEGCYALSIRNFDNNRKIWVVRHYKIHRMDENRGFYISPTKQFDTLLELIDNYSDNNIGRSCKLSAPCPRNYSPPVHFRDLIQNHDAFVKDKKLGAGSFGEVFAGKWNRTVDVAIKTLIEGTMSTEAFLDEAKIMHRLNHPNILPVLAVCTEPEIFIVTEMMSHGALLDILRGDSEFDKPTLEIAIDIAAQIASGMAYLESQELVHRDLRAANILVGDEFLVKVADFGLAKLTERGGATKQDTVMRFPVRWTAPEAMNRQFSIKSDVWSFAVLLYEIITHGRIPYAGMPNNRVQPQVLNGYRMPKPENSPIRCPDKLYDTMMKCWSKQPDDRPTFSYLRDYFDDYFVANEGQYGQDVNT